LRLGDVLLFCCEEFVEAYAREVGVRTDVEDIAEELPGSTTIAVERLRSTDGRPPRTDVRADGYVGNG